MTVSLGYLALYIWHVQNPVKVEVDARYTTVETLRQQYLFVPAKHKVIYLKLILLLKNLDNAVLTDAATYFYLRMTTSAVHLILQCICRR